MSFVTEIKQNQPDSHQSSPWAIIVFYSFVNPDTYYSRVSSTADALRVNPIMVVSDILSVNVSTAKGGSSHSADILLSSGDVNYVSAVNPGDHCAIWINDDKDNYKSVAEAIVNSNNIQAKANETAANSEHSGLKFLGKVESVREVLSILPTGIKTMRYQVSARGFTEFETMIYYNPYIKEISDAANEKMAFYEKISSSFDSLLKSYASAGYPIDNLMEFYINAFIGKGLSSDFKRAKGGSGASVIRSSNNSMLIPNTVSAMLGLSDLKSKNHSSYADILNTIVGVQKYPESRYLPAIGSTYKNVNHKKTTVTLPGAHLGLPDIGSSVSLLSLIQSNMNSALNEIYFTLKLNENNKIMPTMVLRQKPFNTKRGSTRLGIPQDRVTFFTELPRWKLASDRAIRFYNLGTNNATRSNFIQIFGALNASAQNQEDKHIAQILDGNYEVDTFDVLRSGSRNMFYETNADVSANGGGITTSIGYWKNLVIDWTINQHLKFTGSITSTGINEAICPGDNLEFDRKLFHIEAVQHIYQIFDDGSKSFETNLALSHGLLLDEKYLFEDPKHRVELTNPDYPGYSDEEILINGKTRSSIGKPETQ